MNNIKTYARFDAALVYYDQNLDALFLEYTENLNSHDEFVEINISVLSAFKKLKTKNFVADIRKLGFVSSESQSWVAEVLLPGMITQLNGEKIYHAQLLDPMEAMSKISGTGVKLKSDDLVEGFEVEQFTSKEELVNKLISIKDSFVSRN